MKKVKYWRMEIQQLSLTERMAFIDAINTLLSWDVLKGEYLELDLIRRLLESEVQIHATEVKVDKINVLAKLKKNGATHTSSALGMK